MTKKPSYRFGEYTEPWEENKLGEVSTSFSGGTPAAGNKKYYGGEIPFIRSAEINLDKTELFLTKEGLDNSSAKLVKKGDILYALYGATSGEVGISKINGAINQAILSIIPKTNYTSEFIMQWLRLQKKNITDKYLQGGQGNLSGSIVKELGIFFPSHPEQTSIGSFFQDIDQLISLQQRKLEVLKEQKKTYLKLLFPAKGQTKPALRFAGFEDDWKEVKLGEIAELKRGLTYKPTSVVENGIRVLRSSNIDGDVFKKQEDDVFVEDSSVTIPYVQFGDILITAANGSSKLVGKHAIIEDSEKMVHGGFMLLARSKQYKFLNALLSSEWYSRFINVSVAGGNGAIGNLSKSNLEKEIVLCPTIPEQEAIGSFFQDLDKAIAKQEEKVNQLKESKQTLLRKMFI